MKVETLEDYIGLQVGFWSLDKNCCFTRRQGNRETIVERVNCDWTVTV